MTRLTSYFLLLTILAGGLTVYITFTCVKEALKQSAFDRLTAVAALKENELNRWIERQHQLIMLFANLEEVRFHTQTLLAHEKSTAIYQTAYEKLRQLLVAATTVINPELEEIFILQDIDGAIILSTQQHHEGRSCRQETYFTRGQQQSFIQKVYISPITTKPTMTVAVPLYDQQQHRLGVLAAHIDLSYLDRIIQENIGLGETGETYLIDASKSFVSIAHFGTKNFLHHTHTQGIDKALQGKSGVELYHNYDNIPVIGVYRWLKNHELALLAEIHQAEAFAPAHRLAQAILFIGFIILII